MKYNLYAGLSLPKQSIIFEINANIIHNGLNVHLNTRWEIYKNDNFGCFQKANKEYSITID